MTHLKKDSEQMLSTARKRILYTYLGTFAICVGLSPALSLNENTAVVLDGLLWFGFYVAGALVVLRCRKEPLDARMVARLVVSVSAVVFLLYLKPQNYVAALSSYADNALGVVLVAFLGYATNVIVLCFGLLLVIWAATRRMPPGGGVVLIRFALLVVAVSLARTVLAFLFYGIAVSFSNVVGVLVVADSLLAMFLYCFPFYYLMRSYVALPGKEAPKRPREAIDPERAPLAAWLAALLLAVLALCMAQGASGGLLRRLPWSEMALYAGLVGVGVAYAGGPGRGALRSLPGALGPFLFAMAVEQAAISAEALLARAGPGAPPMAALAACGALRCASWAAAVALAVRLLGRAAPAPPRTRAGALLALALASAAVAAAGAAMGLADWWMASASLSPGGIAAWGRLSVTALSGECLFALARWAAGSAALLAVLGLRPSMALGDLARARARGREGSAEAVDGPRDKASRELRGRLAAEPDGSSEASPADARLNAAGTAAGGWEEGDDED